MKAMWQIPLLYFLSYCATQTLGIKITPTPAVSGGIIDVEVNDIVSLVCEHQTTSDAEDDEIVWLRNGAVVKLGEENKNGRSSVCISPVITDDNDATFKCHLRNNSTLEDSVTLFVRYPPELSGTQEVSVEENEELVLECDIWANPPVESVVWTLNDSRVDLLAGSFVVSMDGHTSQLSVSVVKGSMHQGSYKCTADGKYSKIFHVEVTESTMKFPLYPIIAAAVVVFLTLLLAFVSRWRKIIGCCKKILSR